VRAPVGQRAPLTLDSHGGAYTGGSPATSIFDGSQLAARGDIVVVTIAYRLGLLGALRASLCEWR
jgi:para-nitrobenzyl esterase